MVTPRQTPAATPYSPPAYEDTSGRLPPTNAGVPIGGTVGQVVIKASSANFDTAWSTGGGLILQEVDGSPSGLATTLVLPNGTLAIVAGVATYTPGGSSTYIKGAAWDSGGALTSSPVIASAASVVLGVAQASGTIQSCTMTADGGPGSCTVEVWKRAGAIPTVANKISASAPGTLSAASYSLDTTLTGWTTAVTAGDVFAFKLLTSSTLTWLSIALTIG